MTSPLPVDIDASYADSGTDATVKTHQQHHDTLHGFYNTRGVLTAPAPTFALLGDSITEACGGGPLVGSRESGGTVSTTVGITTNRGYWPWTHAYLNAVPKLLWNGGVSGNTSAQILARLTEVTGLTVRPSYCIVHAGVNDIQSNTSPVYSTIIANIAAIWDGLIAAGIQPIATTLLPVSNTYMTTQGQWDVHQQVNTWIVQQARTRNLPLCNWSNSYADPTAGTPANPGSTDGIHPAIYGAHKIGKLMADTLRPLIGTTAIAPGPVSNKPADNLIVNGMMVGNTSGLATSYSSTWNGTAGTVALTKVTRTDEIPGEWQQVSVTANTTGIHTFAQSSGITTGFSAGQTMQFSADFDFVANWTNVTTFQLDVYCWTTGFGTILFRASALDLYDGQGAYLSKAWSGRIRTPDFVIPATTAILYPQIQFKGVGTYRTSRWQLTQTY